MGFLEKIYSQFMQTAVIPSLPAFFILMLFFLGASLGSFCAVLITRFNTDDNIFSPSKCASCGERLDIKDLIPVISYLYYRGKCDYCGAKIPLKLLAIEILAGIYSVIIYFKSGLTPEYAKFMVFFTFLFPVSYIDYLYYKIRLDYLGVCAAVILALYAVFDFSNLLMYLYGGGLGFAFFYVIRFFYKKKLGFGDVFLLSVLGLFTGVNGVFWVVFLGSLLGIIYASICHFFKIQKINQKIPFAPFLSLAALLFMLLSDYVMKILPTSFI